MTGARVDLCLALTLLAALVVVALLVQLARRARRPRGPVMTVVRTGRAPLSRFRGVLRPTVGAVVAAAALLGLLALAQNPRSATGSGLGDPGRTSGGPDRTAGGYTDGPLDLTSRGDLPDTPVLRVPAGSPALWRSGFLTDYTGRYWLPPDTGPDQVVLGSRDVRPPATADDPATADRTGRTDRVGVLAPVRSLVSPGVPSRVRLDRDVPVIADPAIGRLVVGGEPGDYTVTSTVRPDTAEPADAAALRAAAGPDPADPRWLDLPRSVTPRTRDLSARLLQGATTRLDAVLAVETYLRSSYRYTLDSPVPADGADAVDDFLFVSREGFCEQFASAGVVLLRAGGIPARLAVGYAGGDPDGDTRLVRASQAHAWVEVWFPGQGWVSSDPTAGSTPARDLGARVQDWLAAHRWLLVVLAVALVLTGFLLRRALRARRAGGPAVPAGPEAERLAALAALDRLEAVLRTVGSPRRPAESLPRLAGRLADHPDAAPALDVYQRMAFAADPPAPDRARWAAQALDRVSDRLLAEATDRR